MALFQLYCYCLFLLFRFIHCTVSVLSFNQNADPELALFMTAILDPDQDIHELTTSFASMLNDNVPLKIKIASNPRTTMQTLFPLLVRWFQLHSNFRGFPDFSLPPSYDLQCIPQHNYLCIQFYQTLSSAPTLPSGSNSSSVVRKLNALKLIDLCSERNQLIAVSLSEIDQLHFKTDDAVSLDVAFGMIYDPKHYESNAQYWRSLKRFQAEFGPELITNKYYNPLIHALSDVLRMNVALKLELAKSPDLMKSILFPLIMSYHFDLMGFPEFGLSEISRSEIDQDLYGRSLMFFDVLTSCARDLHFVEKLYAIKLIDHFGHQYQELNGVSFEDIMKLAASRRLMVMNQDVITDVLYDPLYHRSTQHFVSFIQNLLSGKHSTMSESDVLIGWDSIIEKWFQSKTQSNVKKGIGQEAFDRLQKSLMTIPYRTGK